MPDLYASAANRRTRASVNPEPPHAPVAPTGHVPPAAPTFPPIRAPAAASSRTRLAPRSRPARPPTRAGVRYPALMFS